MPESSKSKYSRVAEVRARYGGVSDMWLSRKMKDVEFPKPVFFGGRDRFWETDQLDQWDRRMIEAGSTPKPKPVPPSRRKAQS